MIAHLIRKFHCVYVHFLSRWNTLLVIVKTFNLDGVSRLVPWKWLVVTAKKIWCVVNNFVTNKTIPSQLIRDCNCIGDYDTVICRANVGEIWRVIGERINQLGNAIIEAALCKCLHSGRVSHVSVTVWDASPMTGNKLKLVNNRANLNVQRYSKEMLVLSVKTHMDYHRLSCTDSYLQWGYNIPNMVTYSGQISM